MSLLVQRVNELRKDSDAEFHYPLLVAYPIWSDVGVEASRAKLNNIRRRCPMCRGVMVVALRCVRCGEGPMCIRCLRRRHRCPPGGSPQQCPGGLEDLHPLWKSTILPGILGSLTSCGVLFAGRPGIGKSVVAKVLCMLAVRYHCNKLGLSIDKGFLRTGKKMEHFNSRTVSFAWW